MKIEHEKIWNALKEVLREKLIVLSAYIKKKENQNCLMITQNVGKARTIQIQRQLTARNNKKSET